MEKIFIVNAVKHYASIFGVGFKKEKKKVFEGSIKDCENYIKNTAYFDENGCKLDLEITEKIKKYVIKKTMYNRFYDKTIVYKTKIHSTSDVELAKKTAFNNLEEAEDFLSDIQILDTQYIFDGMIINYDIIEID